MTTPRIHVLTSNLLVLTKIPSVLKSHHRRKDPQEASNDGHDHHIVRTDID